MKCSMRNLLVITSTTALVAVLSAGFSGCKKHQLSDGGSQASNSATTPHNTDQAQTGTTSNVGANGSSTDGTSNGQSPHTWSAHDAQVAVGQPNSQTGTNPQNSQNVSGNPVSNTAAGGNTGSTTAASSNKPAETSGVNTVAKEASVPKEIPVTCFTETFKHKATAGHDSEESCSHHKNLISLSHKVINAKSVCVRVNDVPVKFQSIGTGGELLIGSIAGPKAAITVSYCTGKNTCEFTKKNECNVPKDEFLDAIGGSDTDEGAVAQWENTTNEADAKLNNDVKRELANIDESNSDGHTGQAAIFKDWVNEKTAPSCGQSMAKK